MRPHAELAFEGNKLFAEVNLLFGGLRLLPPLQQCREFRCLVLVGCTGLGSCVGWLPSESDHGKYSK
jgi:hypothetical protein